MKENTGTVEQWVSISVNIFDINCLQTVDLLALLSQKNRSIFLQFGELKIKLLDDCGGQNFSVGTF